MSKKANRHVKSTTAEPAGRPDGASAAFVMKLLRRARRVERQRARRRRALSRSDGLGEIVPLVVGAVLVAIAARTGDK